MTASILFQPLLAALRRGLVLGWLCCAVAASAQPAEKSAAFLSAEEQQWIVAHPVVRVASDAGAPPFEFLDSQGIYAGLYADYLAALGAETGLRFERAPVSRRDRLLATVKQGQAELLAGFALPLSADSGLIPVRRVLVRDFPVLVARSDRAVQGGAAQDLRLALVQGYPPAEAHAAATGARQVLPAEGFESALLDVALGRADVSVLSLAIAENLILNRGLQGLRVTGSAAVEPADQYWAVAPAAAPLAGILEKAWDRLPPQRHRQIRAGSMPLPNPARRIRWCRAGRRG